MVGNGMVRGAAEQATPPANRIQAMMIPVRKIDEATGQAPEEPNAALNSQEVSSVEVTRAPEPTMEVRMQNGDAFPIRSTPEDFLPKLNQ